jgi:hypothetical protein
VVIHTSTIKQIDTPGCHTNRLNAVGGNFGMLRAFYLAVKAGAVA